MVDLYDLYDYMIYFLAIATNIPQRLKNGFVLQGHILLYWFILFYIKIHTTKHHRILIDVCAVVSC